MGKKLGLSSLFFRLRDTPRPSCHSSSPSPPPSWPWPSCKHPKTSSFREVEGDATYKTVNSVYVESTESCFTRSSAEQESFSTVSDRSGGGSVETVVRGLRSDRLFFEPGGDTSSILEEAKAGVSPFEGSVVLAMESEDPYRDFRRSMEEMVAAHGLNDWERLEELLVWYLKVNGKKTHRFVAAAFADLVLGLASPRPPPSSSSSSSNSFKIEAIKEAERSESS
ncbi:unnamed protein product [Musa acuminata subsp. malaccensis]|uniref:Transcription repressor n=1 Tax=Musa acuminata subsp. malaccensis TaxID=214687 RepID=A0A804J5T2_MUSAM|nr:unnamed protein product [Musa acuminata subsp. malaccensis]